MRQFHFLIALAVLFGLAVIPAQAQSTTGSIVGDITDASGARLPGVTVKVVNQQTGAAREIITNELGSYRASALVPAQYSVTAEFAGFKTVTRSNLTLPIASQVSVDFQLEVASMAESITVTEQAPLVETTENAIKTLIDNQRIQELPLKSRDFLELTMLAPGVVTDQGSAAGGNTDSISFSGLGERYKSIWLEGVDFNDEVTGGGSSISSATRTALAQEAIQEFQVMSNSYSAEFGRSASGAINVVTKSGGNEFHGNAFYFRRDDAFDKPNALATSVPPFKINQYGATLGGPIVKDKFHFFTSFERQRAEKSVTVSVPESIRSFAQSLGYDTRTLVPANTRVYNLFQKFSLAINPQHSLAVTYLYDDRILDNQQVGANSAGDHGFDDVRDSYFVVANLTSTFGGNFVNEFRYNKSMQKLYRYLPAGTTSRPELVFPSVSFGRASNVPQGRGQYNTIYSNATSFHFAAKGDHDLKWGGEANIIPTTSEINQSYNGQFSFRRDAPVVATDAASLPYLFRQGIELRGKLSALTRDVNIYALFVNDSWKVNPRLALNIGLRYDFQFWRGDLNGTPFPKDIAETDFWRRLLTPGDPFYGKNFRPAPNDLNNFAPRLGFSFDPAGTGKTVVRGGYGIYYDQITTTQLRSVVAGYPGFISTQVSNNAELTRVSNSFFPNVPVRGTLSESSAGTTFLIPSRVAESPYSQQYAIGMTRQVGQSYAVSADFVYLYGVHFERTQNVNACSPCLPAAQRRYPLVSSGVRMDVMDTGASVQSRQLQLRMEKRFSNRLGFLFGYTLGKIEDHASNPQDWYNRNADWGPASNDVRHRIVSNALYELPLGIHLGTVMTFNTAPPYNITAGADLNGDGSSSDRPEGVKYNAARGGLRPVINKTTGRSSGTVSEDGRVFSFDLRTSKKFNFGENVGLEVLWEMFNLFNTQNYARFNGNSRAATFRTAQTAFDPFQGQFGIKFTF